MRGIPMSCKEVADYDTAQARMLCYGRGISDYCPSCPMDRATYLCGNVCDLKIEMDQYTSKFVFAHRKEYFEMVGDI
jgi:hypothetical protein